MSDAERDLAAENELLREQLRTVTEIGIALSAERDLNRLLATILASARRLTHADAGSLYLLEGEEREQLRFVLAQNDSREVPFVEMLLPVQARTIVGYVVRERTSLSIPDVYRLPADAPYGFSSEFDESVGYRCKSMLAVPMVDHEGDVIGALQLINRKPTAELRLRDPAHAEEVVLPFTDTCQELIRSLASQSAVAIDKARLIDDLEKTFEGLVTASVVAIESRDPTTSGHSERVAKLSVELAKAVSDVGVGKFAQVRFSADQLQELRFASLLHDFGKVGVREQVLVKAKKLYPWDLDVVRMRFLCALRERESRALRELVHLIRTNPGVDPTPFIHAAEEQLGGEVARVRGMLAAVLEANEPRLLPEGRQEELGHIARECFQDEEGHARPLLTQEELMDLSIARGSLNREQRLEIESHVTHTYRFLSQIPWSKNLRELPRIAYSHHEKLDGTGYPRGLRDEEIPPQSKIMAVADIFDALTAWDRPYKKAVPLDKALEILEAEAKGNKLEAELVGLFRERRLYESVMSHSH